MSILSQLISGKKPTVASTLGVKKDEQETKTIDSTSSARAEVVSQGTQTSILGNAGKNDISDSSSGRPATGGILGALAGSGNEKRPDSVTHAATVTKPKTNLLTSTLTAVREKSEQDKADHEYLFAPIPKDFQETLDRFDAMMQRDNEILAIDLTRCRDFVKHIMISLKENPEYDGLIIDRDVHNIIKFQRNLKAAAEATVVTKIDKAAKKSTKPKAAGRFAMDMTDFDLNAPAKPKSIQDLSGFEL